MSQWFTVEKIDDATFVFSEYGHWEEMHSYLLIGSHKALLIDTGLGIGHIKSEVELLTDLPIEVITTHVHWDHIGGHHLFQNISVHENDAQWLINGIPIGLEMVKKNLMHEPFRQKPPNDFDVNQYQIYTGQPTRILHDLDLINIGNRNITVLHTPGHSPGHICLWEVERGYLFTGDLIYQGTLSAFYPSTNPQEFKHSIERVSHLKTINKILPAHHELSVPIDLIKSIKAAFEWIDNKALLKHGSGIFEFENFKIHL